MSNEYDFILDSLNYSYSSVNSYETCALGFKMTYIDYKERNPWEEIHATEYGTLNPDGTAIQEKIGHKWP